MNNSTHKPLLARHRGKICTVLVFVAVLFAGDRLVGYGIERMVLSSQFRYSRIYTGGMDTDILVLGNSRALHSIYAPDATERLGVEVYNAGYNAIPTVTTDVILRDYLERNEPPAIVLLEATGLALLPHRNVQAFTLYFGCSENIASLVGTYQPRKALGCRVSSTFRANGPMLQRALIYTNRTDQTWISPAARTIPEELLNTPLPDDPLALHPDNIEALKRMIDACNEHDVRLMLFLAPFSPGAYGERDVAAEYADILAEAVPGAATLIDYTTAIDVPEAFSDRMHTNARGAELLLDRIVKDDLFELGDAAPQE